LQLNDEGLLAAKTEIIADKKKINIIFIEEVSRML